MVIKDNLFILKFVIYYRGINVEDLTPQEFLTLVKLDRGMYLSNDTVRISCGVSGLSYWQYFRKRRGNMKSETIIY
ncbi:MAG: hypothetical protein PWP39_910, partial [Pyrococcus sp.]|nr:hypothetical protein [Pyrococcus sp.]